MSYKKLLTTCIYQEQYFLHLIFLSYSLVNSNETPQQCLQENRKQKLKYLNHFYKRFKFIPRFNLDTFLPYCYTKHECKKIVVILNTILEMMGEEKTLLF